MGTPVFERVRHVLAVALSLLALAASASPGQETNLSQRLAGRGEWQSLSSAAIKGKWTAALVRTGDRVQGTLTLTDSNVLSGGSVTGHVDTSSIMLGVIAQGSRQATFSGKIDGDSVKGEWDLDSDVLKDHGVWYGTLGVGAVSDAAAEQ